MNVLFLGTALPPVILNQYINKGNISDIPAYVFGWNFVRSLIDNNINVSVINDLKMPYFPKNKKLFVDVIQYNAYNLSYLPITKMNINMVEKISKQIRINTLLRKKIKKSIDVIMIYSLHSPYLIPAIKYAKKKNIPIITIVPDLPQYMSSNYSGIKKFLKKYDMNRIKKLENDINGFIILTEYMKNYINVSKRKTLIIEGIANTEYYNYSDICLKKDYILYTGAVEKRYGLPNLINSYLTSKVDSELWICGDGDYVEELKNICKLYSNIKYLGIKNRNEIIVLQQNAQLLVNPRSKLDKYTELSFPSKTIEYLLSATPVMMERLKGIPEEYFKYIIDAGDDWKLSISNYFQIESKKRKKIGLDGRNFILNNKTSLIQGKKIHNFIKDVCSQYKKCIKEGE